MRITLLEQPTTQQPDTMYELDELETRISELNALIYFLEDGGFDWINEVPEELRGAVEDSIEHGIQWCAEQRDWHAAAKLEDVQEGRTKWRNEIGTTARCVLCDVMEMLRSDYLDDYKNELDDLEFELAELEEEDNE